MNEMEYCSAFISAVPSYLEELERETGQKMINSRMCSGAYQGRVLSMISKLLRPKFVLELGSFTGYSSLCLAEGIHENGVLDTIEKNNELEWIHRKYLRERKGMGKIQVTYGDAIQLLPQFEIEKYDLFFVDADKENYMNYWREISRRCKQNAVILLDNVLWGGKVLEEASEKDISTQVLQQLNFIIRENEQFESVILPIRDGLTLVRKK
jgi:predicted O-methyltransferase YrrM